METLAVAAVLILAISAVAIVLLVRRMRHVSRSLQRSEELYRSIVDSQTALICRYLPDTTLTFVNDAYCDYFGKPRSELIGAKFIDLIPEDEHEGVLRHVASVVEDGLSISYTHGARGADGNIHWQQWIDQRIVDADGDVSELQAIGTDVTDLKCAEKELLKQRAQVLHLTRVASIGEVSGAIAHDLNQPLAALLSNAQALEMLLESESPDLAEGCEITRDIVAETKRAGQIVHRLRALLKKGEFTPERIDTADLIGEAVTLLHGELLDQNIDVVYDIAAQIPAIFGDRVQLLQLMLNLLINSSEAIGATASHDREIRVSAKAGEAGDVLIAVADTGCGIPPDVAERVFEPFYSTKQDGMGLGLSIARSIVRAHDGRVELWNNDSGGAVLAITLPQAPAKPADAGAATERST